MSFLAKSDELVAGRYLLQKPIGEGGMGGVWEAKDQVLGCPVALKMVPAKHLEGDRAQQIQRFLREARLAAAVQHPGVVRVTDFGIHEDTPYIAMELLDGESLAERMYRVPLLEIDEAVQIAIGVLRGLGAAHGAGVVHRDIKPENVLLSSSVEGVYPKLIDFGISLGTDTNNRRISAVTTDGHIFGTPLYMSPEHARGLEVDGRSDLYSLAVVLYEMITRRPPFSAENSADMMASIVRDIPVVPRKIRPTIPRELSDAVMKALEKDPDDRFDSALEMAKALAAAMPLIGVDVTGPIALGSGVHRIAPDAETLAPPKPRLMIAAVLTLIALAVGMWLFVDLTAEDPPARALVEESAPEASVVEPEEAPPVVDFMPTEAPDTEEEAESPQEVVESPPSPMVVAPTRRAAPRAERAGSAASSDEGSSDEEPDSAMTTAMTFRELDY